MQYFFFLRIYFSLYTKNYRYSLIRALALPMSPIHNLGVRGVSRLASSLTDIIDMTLLSLDRAAALLNQTLENRLLGVARYTHYALMVSGQDRLRLANFFTDLASQSLQDAQGVSRWLMALNERPRLDLPALTEPSRQSTQEMLLRALHHERKLFNLYQGFLAESRFLNPSLTPFVQSMSASTAAKTDELGRMLEQFESCVLASPHAS